MTGAAYEVESGGRVTEPSGVDPTICRLRALGHALARITGYDHPAKCAHCDATSLHRWGTGRRGLQRWRCRACWRTFSAATGTPFARLHSLDKLALVVADMSADLPSSCRRLATLLRVDAMTVWRWRRQIMTLLQRLDPQPPATCLIAATSLRESRKASREWVDHRRHPQHFPKPDRLRWIDYRLRHLPLPRPMSPYRVPIALLGDAAGGSHLVVGRPGIDGRTLHPAHTAAAPSSAEERPPIDRIGGRRPTPDDRLEPCQPIPRFERFLRPFCGPATRHLAGYAAWFGHRQSRDRLGLGRA
jgi:transposase-like protein